QEPAFGVDRQPTSDAGGLALHERATIALGAETRVLQFGDHVDGEVVRDAGQVDVVTGHPGYPECGLCRETPTLETGEARRRARIEVAVALSPAEQHHGVVAPLCPHVGRPGHDDA